jgi:hypothetical protein
MRAVYPVSITGRVVIGYRRRRIVIVGGIVRAISVWRWIVIVWIIGVWRIVSTAPEA